MSDPTVIDSFRPLAAVTISLVGMILVMVFSERRRLRIGCILLAAIGQFLIVASMIPGAASGVEYETALGVLVADIDFVLRADPLGMIYALVASGLYVVTVIYAVGYLEATHSTRRPRFLAALALSLAAAVGVAFAGNLLILVLFYEFMTIGTYPLVAHDQTQKARRVGYKYVAYVLIGGTAAVLGTVFVFYLAGTVEFVAGGIPELAAVTQSSLLASVAFASLIFGFGVKAAIMPLHSWLPSAMVAPTPVSGLLHAVAVVKSGVFGIGRVILDVFGPAAAVATGLLTPLAVIAGITILLAGLLALRQNNLKRRLAYSTIAQLSYIVLGFAILTPLSVLGGLLHIIAHAAAKLTLFFCAGALYAERGLEDIDNMAGVAREMPIVMTGFAIGSFSLAGIPLFAGFVSKWNLMLGSGTESIPALVVFFLAGVLSVAYLWPVVYTAFFETPEHHDTKPLLDGPFGGISLASNNKSDAVQWTGEQTRATLLWPTAITAAVVIAFGLLADTTSIYEIAVLAIEQSVEGQI
ncbi:monovalent cation/H+ antiporter subunit D family protein [Salinarchaeum sp. IM2453]|uniref:proton-conducting transporter transmembrane domain-containing protein n=1 Tax=Salinarchaeum sp. IM2453 TaxID=2862870 RepID=UPI001C8342D0|nr:proton-conducting transporter membrane subunit [Salinarchaeum sp. IM2453]QZA88451.1 monovalent cation/H+ antiporter subunit D family protein [Salinarchaeum sp. IM2453]